MKKAYQTISQLIFTFIIAVSAGSAFGFEPNANLKRSDIPELYQWDPSHIFSSPKIWEKERKQIIKNTELLVKSCKGKMGDSAQVFSKCYEGYYDLSKNLWPILQYARFRFDVDKSNQKNKAMVDQATQTVSEFSSLFSFMSPEVISIGKDKIFNDFIPKIKSLQTYTYDLSELFRLENHVRSQEIEKVLSDAGNFFSAATRIFEETKKDLAWKSFQTPEQKQEPINDQNYVRYRQHIDPAVRKNATQAFFDSYKQSEDIFAQNLVNEIKLNHWISSTRGYASTKERMLKSANVPLEVYSNLISTVHKNLKKTTHRYVKLKKKILQRPKYEIHDNYASTFPSFSKDVPYEKASEMILTALAPLGSQVADILKTGLDPRSGWIDIYPNANKHSNPYNWGVYDVHTYILMNYDNSYNSVSTLGHELGHGLHFWLSMKKQPYVYHDALTFTAEMASTGIEMLLLSHLIQDAEKRKATEELLYLYDQVLQQIQGSFFRQTQFAEFEDALHQNIESGKSLTTDRINEIYLNLVKEYYGPDYSVMKNQEIEWAYVGHFYRNYYVYVYATSISAAIAMAQGIEQGKIAPQAFVDFLSAGSSLPAIELAKSLGVDLSTSKPFQATADYYAQTLNKFERLYRSWEKSKASK
ncbi:MAG: oligoendopeptidase F family protein [Bdellovibrionales bacterium]|nr:oligoendopeptidase F family protein [Bdellovibrionales bacterium]